jgi:universal stress protein E
MQFRKILVFAHGEVDAQGALRRAAALARHHDARLVVMDVVEPLPRGAAAPFGTAPRDLNRMLLRHRTRELRAAVAAAGARRAHVVVSTGKPFVEVIRAVLRRGFDLVVKPAEGHALMRSLLFGSTDHHLLRKCPCPVLLLPPGQGRPFRKIMAAVDPDPSDRQRDLLNDDILALAVQLSKEVDGELSIVHAWQLLHERLMRGGLYRVPRNVVDEMGREERDTHRRNLAMLLRRVDLQGVRPAIVLVKGDPRVRLPRVARARRMDLVVLGTVGRGGLPGLLIGNTAESILSQVRCAVLAVKPRGFRSPVKLERQRPAR